jgi:hypothetical protein
MRLNVIFTIVTNNYIPLSNILGDSIKQSQPNTDFIVFVIGGFDENIISCNLKYKHISINNIGINNINELAFKYDLTEFCTAIKPICFEYIFELNYDKVIYLDPDIYVFSNINHIFAGLDDHPICLAPHIIYPELNYTGYWPQGRILAAGVFNLGFIGLKKNDRTILFITWWKNNLERFCFNERREGLFTDQKWMNFCPIYFPETLIIRDLGVDVALWNIHEREIVFKNNSYYVRKRNSENKDLSPLYFFHFSNLKFRNADCFERLIPFNLEKIPDAIEIIKFYGKEIIKSDFLLFNNIPNYKYNYFDNGIHINKIHRRFYRKLLDNNIKFEHPFSTDENSFYWLLKKNKLISKEKVNYDNVLLRSRNHSSYKFKIAKLAIRIIFRIFGFKNYILINRFILWLSRYENQLFLIKEYDKYINAKPREEYININN